MRKVNLWLKREKLVLRQVQSFIPLPMSVAATMYHTKINPYTGEQLYVPKAGSEKKHQQRMLQPHKKKFVKKSNVLKRDGKK